MPVNVVAETKASQAKPVLTFALRYAAQLQDVVFAGNVEGVLAEDLIRFVLAGHELVVRAGELQDRAARLAVAR